MKKGLIALCVVGVVFLVLNIIVFINNHESYVIFNDKSVIKVTRNGYDFVDFNDKYFVNRKFEVYDYNKYLGSFNVKAYDDSYRVYDKKETVNFSNSFIGIYSKNKRVKLNTSNVSKLDNSDMNILNRILSFNNVQLNSELSVNEKRAINFKNGYYLYNVSYNDCMGNSNKPFSAIYVSNSQDYAVIESDFSASSCNQLISYNIDAVIDLDGDGVDEIVMSYLSFSQSGENTKKIYKFDGNKYVSLK